MNSLNRDWEKEFKKLWDENINENGYDIVHDFIFQAILSAEEETVKRCIDALPRFDHSKLEKDPNPTHYKDEVWCCIECYDDDKKNSAIDQATKALSNQLSKTK